MNSAEANRLIQAIEIVGRDIRAIREKMCDSFGFPVSVEGSVDVQQNS